MKKKYWILNLSFWLALITILIFPGKVLSDVRGIGYGFPFTFLIQYHYETNGYKWFIQGVHIQVLNYLLNVAIIYVILYGLSRMYKVIRNKDVES